MDKKAVNEAAKKEFENWLAKRAEIEKEASGKWNEMGLDANTQLFRQINNETKAKLSQLSALVKE